MTTESVGSRAIRGTCAGECECEGGWMPLQSTGLRPVGIAPYGECPTPEVW